MDTVDATLVGTASNRADTEITGQPPAHSEPSLPAEVQMAPAEVVRQLDEYIIGQAHAKRAVAIALRNRVRRQRLAEPMRSEVLPKNILMIGPTGVGKTEIARRLARLTSSPFIKVEATKFTEVGYVGRDVESIVRDLLEATITEVHNRRISESEAAAKSQAESRIVEALWEAEAKRRNAAGSTLETGTVRSTRAQAAWRRRARKNLQLGKLEARLIEIEVEEPWNPPFEGFAGTGLEEMGMSLSDFFSQMAPPRKRAKRMTVADARQVLIQDETDRLIDMDRVYDDAIRMIEDDGIVFIDEVDKICSTHSGNESEVSGEGVQRDLLPLLEGSTVHTRYGPLRTDHILFVAAGAFTMSRPSDLIPEFQGRFPIRVELSSLSQGDLERILTEPNNALTKQYAALLGTEDVTLDFTADGVAEMSRAASMVNEQDENIGARRLFTIMEKVLEDVSFNAEGFAGQTVRIDGAFVSARLAGLVSNDEIRRFVL